MKNFTVYKHINKINNKAYVGITSKSAHKRWANGKGYSSCRRFNNAIKKYGWDSFEHIIVKTGLTKASAIRLEREIIKRENLSDPAYGYNLTSGGEHFLHGESTKRKMSEHRKAMKGHFSKEAREALSKGLKGNHNNNRAVSQYDLNTGSFIKTYPSVSLAAEMVGARPCNISLSCRGKIKSSGGFIWKYADDTSPVDVNAHIGKSKNIPVQKYDKDGNHICDYPSIKSAAKANGLDASAIGKACKGKAKAVGGFLWKYSPDSAESQGIKLP